eukprot:6195125-Pleurochrysis_carterae.AAC.2
MYMRLRGQIWVRTGKRACAHSGAHEDLRAHLRARTPVHTRAHLHGAGAGARGLTRARARGLGCAQALTALGRGNRFWQDCDAVFYQRLDNRVPNEPQLKRTSSMIGSYNMPSEGKAACMSLLLCICVCACLTAWK